MSKRGAGATAKLCVLLANYLSLESILNESSDEEEEDYSDTFNDADSSLLNFVRKPQAHVYAAI